eukprot:CAMPEP_0174259584 /NCGR_PEP_ID=MMETSP0439-20130205/8394_1 /TAXON_ID=0 /ORGANISM="Stereomyxa ramosa, Strain Chinc5" /LENGTH=352 /DNA_ID=CAMNT_0015343531 /DNA_START=166 /DNA_END=1224 /DNA_ORIENTATION=+
MTGWVFNRDHQNVITAIETFVFFLFFPVCLLFIFTSVLGEKAIQDYPQLVGLPNIPKVPGEIDHRRNLSYAYHKFDSSSPKKGSIKQQTLPYPGSIEREAYVTLLLEDQKSFELNGKPIGYLEATLLLVSRLRETSARPVIVLYDQEVISEESVSKLKQLGAITIPIKQLFDQKVESENKGQLDFQNLSSGDEQTLYMKLQMWKMVDWNKLVYISANHFVQKSLDGLFDCARFCAIEDPALKGTFGVTLFTFTPSLQEYLKLVRSFSNSLDDEGQSLLVFLNYFYGTMCDRKDSSYAYKVQEGDETKNLAKKKSVEIKFWRINSLNETLKQKYVNEINAVLKQLGDSSFYFA